MLLGPVLFGPVLLGAGTPGNSRVAVSPPPGVSDSRAVPPFEVTRRCTIARPSPVPFGLEVVKRRKARSRSSALMPGPSSATVIRAPAVVAIVVTVTWPPALSASSALATRLSSTCSRCPSPIQASTDERTPLPPLPPSTASSTMPRSSATGCHATSRSLATSATSTTAGTGTTFCARATASRPSTSRDSRASSSSAPASSCPVVSGSGSVYAGSRSSRSRRAASGGRSWCDTSAITARFPCTRASSRPAMVLNVLARRQQLRWPGIDHGPDGQVAVGQPARRGVQAGQRPAHPPGQAEGQQGRADHGEHGDRAEDDPEPEDVAVQRAGRPGQDHGADQPVPTAPEDGHGGGDSRPGGLGDRLHRLARILRELTLLTGPDGQPDPVAGRHAVVDQPVVVLRGATQDQQAVADLPRLVDQHEQGGVGLA